MAFRLNKDNVNITADNRFIRLQQEPEKIRSETIDGVDYIVVPCIALVEGVLHAANAEDPELSLASEFGKFPGAWNGRPVTLDHPKREGFYVSAAQNPNVFSEEAVGTVFNAKVEDKKLKVEFWVNKSKVSEEERERWASGKSVEVSTGFFTEIIPVEEQNWTNGRRFNGIQTSITPDHIAILSEGSIGACSVEDGCGLPRTNAGNFDLKINKLDSTGNLVVGDREKAVKTKDCGCGCGGNCSQKTRENAKEWRTEQLIQLGEGDEILSLGEDIKVEELTTVETASYIVGADSKDTKVGDTYNTRAEAEDFARVYADENETWTGVYVSEGTRDSGEVVYRKVTEFMPDYKANKGGGKNLAQILLDKKDRILQTLKQSKPTGSQGEDPAPVVDAKTKVEQNMEKQELIDALMANKEAPFKDAEVLALFDEDELLALNEKYTEEKEDISVNGGGGDQPEKDEPKVEKDTDIKVEDFVANGKAMEHLPSEVQAFLTRSLAAETKDKENIVKVLTEAKYPESKEILMGKTLDELKALSAWASKNVEADYSGLGGPQGTRNNSGIVPIKTSAYADLIGSARKTG